MMFRAICFGWMALMLTVTVIFKILNWKNR